MYNHRVNIQNNLNRMKSGPEPIDLKEINAQSCAYVEKDDCIISGLGEFFTGPKVISKNSSGC